jgi:hypothetical protein
MIFDNTSIHILLGVGVPAITLEPICCKFLDKGSIIP